MWDMPDAPLSVLSEKVRACVFIGSSQQTQRDRQLHEPEPEPAQKGITALEPPQQCGGSLAGVVDQWRNIDYRVDSDLWCPLSASGRSSDCGTMKGAIQYIFIRYLSLRLHDDDINCVCYAV